MDYLGGGPQAEYISRYAQRIGAWSIVVEHDYIDKEYLIDFSRFYSRSFGEKKAETTRIHFFDGQLSRPQLKNLITKSETSVLQNSYLGFSVVKPIEMVDGDNSWNIIGRTVLATYSENMKNHKRVYLKDSQRASLYGHELKIESLPFQSKDVAVGMCASAALWTAMHRIFHAFDVEKNSLYEITEIASRGDPTIRSFPSDGLTLQQACYYLKSKGLEVEVIGVEKSIKTEGVPKTEAFVLDTIRAYLQGGIPVIAGLEMSGLSDGLHAVVISGYCLDPSYKIKELYVHDDEIGPYASVFPNGSFLKWKYGRPDGWDSKIDLRYLIVPLYHKIRYPFGDIFDTKQIFELRHKKRAEVILYELNNYRAFLIGQDFKNKTSILTRPMPRFLWVIRAYDEDMPSQDVVFDATSPVLASVVEIAFR